MTELIVLKDDQFWRASLQPESRPLHKWEGIEDLDLYVDEFRRKKTQEYNEALERSWKETGTLKRLYLKWRKKDPALPCDVWDPKYLEQKIEFIQSIGLQEERKYKITPLDITEGNPIRRQIEIRSSHLFTQPDAKLDIHGWGNAGYKKLVDQAIKEGSETNYPYVSIDDDLFFRKEVQLNPLSRKIQYFSLQARYWNVIGEGR